ncbi:PHD finger protein 7, partial [Merops nubicus]
VCMLCLQAEVDPDLCGPRLEQEGLCAHLFCLLFSSGLYQQPGMGGPFIGFPPEAIRQTIGQAAQKDCFVCGHSGATINCWQWGCNRSFHLPCAVRGECITQYLPEYRAFCFEHRPQQAVEATPKKDTSCIVCMEDVDKQKCYRTLVCPACKHAWFHRGQALRAGITCFRCPLCRDRELFCLEMQILGIQIPFRRPAWEDNDAFAALGERHNRCDARECLCPGGREQAEGEGPWQLLLCLSCAAQGTHRSCSNWPSSSAIWECHGCA